MSKQYLYMLQRSISDIKNLLNEIKTGELQNEWERTNKSVNSAMMQLEFAYQSYDISTQQTGGLLSGYINLASLPIQHNLSG